MNFKNFIIALFLVIILLVTFSSAFAYEVIDGGGGQFEVVLPVVSESSSGSVGYFYGVAGAVSVPSGGGGVSPSQATIIRRAERGCSENQTKIVNLLNYSFCVDCHPLKSFLSADKVGSLYCNLCDLGFVSNSTACVSKGLSEDFIYKNKYTLVIFFVVISAGLLLNELSK